MYSQSIDLHVNATMMTSVRKAKGGSMVKPECYMFSCNIIRSYMLCSIAFGLAVTEEGFMVKQAEQRRRITSMSIMQISDRFVLLFFETLCELNSEVVSFIHDLVSTTSPRQGPGAMFYSSLVQRISVVVQVSNVAAVLGSKSP